MGGNRLPCLDHLQEMERELGIVYPEPFRRMIADAASPARDVLLKSFPDYFSVHSAADMRSLQEVTGADMYPFLVTGNIKDGDIYCFAYENGKLQPEVLAVSDEAIVATWPDFSTFIAWAEELLEPCPPEDLYLVD